jgi:glycosyltransferase involved in cell wall biosynthesis
VSVVEAMAAGLPVASMPVGDVKRMLSPENAQFVAEWPTEVRLRDVIQGLINHPDIRAQVGAANRAKAAAEYDEATMVARYAALYEEAMGRPGVLGG